MPAEVYEERLITSPLSMSGLMMSRTGSDLYGLAFPTFDFEEYGSLNVWHSATNGETAPRCCRCLSEVHTGLKYAQSNHRRDKSLDPRQHGR